jgi:hypothetical protein
VDDRRRPALGHVVAQPSRHLVERGQVERATDVPQAGEPPHLPFEVARRAPEVAEAVRLGVHRVQLGERGDQRLAQRGAALGERRGAVS